MADIDIKYESWMNNLLDFKIECAQTDNGLEFTKRLGNSKNPTRTVWHKAQTYQTLHSET